MYMTSKEICTELKINRRTLYLWIRKGDFPCTRFGRQWRFELDKVKEWAETFGRKSL